MNSLAFLLLRTFRNSLLEILRNKKKLTMYILFLVLLAAVTAVSFLPNNGEGGGPADIGWLTGAIFCYLLLFFVIAVSQGLSQGSTLFEMEDVNLLFVSPVDPRSVLLYGVARVMRNMALASVFIFFQTNTLKSFGVGVSGVAILYGGYLLATVVTQIMGLVIYSLTNGKPRRKTLVKALTVLLFLPLIATAVWQLADTGGNLPASLLALCKSPAMAFTPILGWASAGVVAFIGGQIAAGALYFGLLILLGGALVAVIYIGKPDYYEDVLVASETAFERKREAAEGKVSLDHQQKRVRVKATGIGGFGASALFRKHLRETFRASRFGLWGIPTLAKAAGAALFAQIVVHSSDAGPNAPVISFVAALGIMLYLQFFTVGMGRGFRETLVHYIYLIPEPPYRKMLWSNLEIVIKAAGEGFLIFVAAGVVAGVGAALILISVLCYALFCFVLIGINYLSMRFAGTNINAGILVMLYMLGVIVLMVPGVLAAVFAALAGAAPAVAVGLLGVWELLAGCILFWASKGILHTCDMPVIRQFGK